MRTMGEVLYIEQERRRRAGSFGYGDFGLRKEPNLGSAVADKIIDDANQSWTDAQIQDAKAKWRTMVLNIQNAVASRNEAIDAIQKMPDGADKTLAIGQFNDADSVFMEAYQQAQPLFQQIGNLTGDTFPVANDANFGVFPVLAVAAILAAATAIAYIATAMYESHLKYDAIKTNPAVAPYVNPPGILPSILNGSLGTKLVVGGIVLIVAAVAAKKYL